MAYSMWDQKYAEADAEGKKILDDGARRWVKGASNFSELDEEDQALVVKNENYKHGDHVHYDATKEADAFIEKSNREVAKRALPELLQKAGNFRDFFDAARREGYTDDEIQAYIAETDKDTDKAMFQSQHGE